MASRKTIQQMTFAQWEKAFPTEDHCRAYLKDNRWPEGVSCPRCGHEKVYAVAFHYRWVCKNCSPNGYRFSVIAGTIFENTNKPLRDWFRVIHLMLTSKKGISALQIHRMMGFGSYSTAHYMCMRVRAGLANEDFRKLMGVVEVDETFVGGDDDNRHHGKKVGHKNYGGKTPVIGAVARGGKVVCRVLDRVTQSAMETFVRQTVANDVSLLATDEHRGYYNLAGYGFAHEAVNHSQKKYVVGAIHTNTIEGFWSLVKRGVMGSYHKVSRKYLPLYVAEFQFRYNNRSNANIFADAVRGF
jgi:transposase-like protein